MKSKWILMLITVSVLMLGSRVSAQTVTQTWLAWYNNVDDDKANAIAVDASGNVYVTGQSIRSTVTWDWDYATVKYNSSGIQQWAKRYNGTGNTNDYAKAIVVDASGNVYVTGSSGSDVVTIKYNGSNGNSIWTKTYTGGSGEDISLDAAESYVHVAGESGGKALVIKYNATNGNQSWAKKDVNGSAEAIALDPSNNVYASGTNGTGGMFLTVKYLPNGTFDWQAQTGGGTANLAHDVVVGADGNIYVTGESYRAATNWDCQTVSYTPGGNFRWVKLYDGVNSKDKAFAIATDTSSNVYITGYDYGLGPGETRDIVTIKYNSGGTQLWAATYNGPADRDDWGTAIAVDCCGNAYVAGYSENASFNNDYVTIKYDSNGAQKWVVTYNGAGAGDAIDEALAIAIDDTFHVYVTGFSDRSTIPASTDRDYVTIKYSQSGGRGDANGDGIINSADIVYLINFLFKGGPAPCPLWVGDANSDGIINSADVVYLINFLFKGGPPPCGCNTPISPGSGSELYKGEAPAQMGFSSPSISKDGIFNVPIIGKFDVDVAAVELEIKYDPEEITLLEPGLTSRTEGLQIYSSTKDGMQKIGILDLRGEHYVSAGTGALVNLRMKGSDVSGLKITKAILVNPDAQLIPVNVVSEMKKSEEDFTGEKSAVPQEFSLSQNYPNPFNPETKIKYALPQNCHVKLIIYNIAGQKVKTLVDEYQTAGCKTIHWNGRDDQGEKIASGVYLYRIKAGDFSQSRKMLLIR